MGHCRLPALRQWVKSGPRGPRVKSATGSPQALAAAMLDPGESVSIGIFLPYPRQESDIRRHLLMTQGMASSRTGSQTDQIIPGTQNITCPCFSTWYLAVCSTALWMSQAGTCHGLTPETSWAPPRNEHPATLCHPCENSRTHVYEGAPGDDSPWAPILGVIGGGACWLLPCRQRSGPKRPQGEETSGPYFPGSNIGRVMGKT